jgi:chemotaxis protein CheZ
MVDSVKTQESGDSAELEALFDSISSDHKAADAPSSADAASGGDSGELQALFDSVAEQSRPILLDEDGSPQERVFNRLGQMARQLHDALRELGYDKVLEDTAKQIPDARQRLSYISQMTEQAASRVLNATDAAKPLQDEMLAQTTALATRWERVYANELTVEEFKQLAGATRDYFRTAQEKHRVTNEHLMEIIMAQDFQDLTGQVIKRVVDMAQQMESSLVSVLIEAIPADRKIEAPDGLLNGPVMDATGRNDVVSSQGQVDDLLESLGF